MLRQILDTVPTVGDVLSAGHDVIYQLPMIHDGLRGVADFLIKVPMASNLGDFSYEPVDEFVFEHLRECLAAGCTEITVWGVYDGATWLDDFLGRERTSPLLFDHDFEPKPAYTAVVDELVASAASSAPPGDG